MRTKHRQEGTSTSAAPHSSPPQEQPLPIQQEAQEQELPRQEEEEKTHKEGKAPFVEEKEKMVLAPLKTPSPLIEEEAEHQSDNLNDYDEYTGGSSSENETSEGKQEEQEEEEQVDKDPSPPKQFDFDRLEEEVEARVQ